MATFPVKNWKLLVCMHGLFVKMKMPAYDPDRGFHREQLSIENSMQNLDSAVGRLDNIFMSVYVIIAIIIYAAVLVGFCPFIS